MKKFTLFLLLISSLYSSEQFYLGSNLGVINEKFSDGVDAQSSSYIATLKAGYGIRKNYALEFSFDYIDTKSKIFSSSGSADANKIAFNIELVKTFDFHIHILPFLKAGFGTGYFNIQRQTQDMLYYGSLNIGTGAFIPLNDTFDIEIGYAYKSISYEPIDTIADKIKYTSNANRAYIGFNVRF